MRLAQSNPEPKVRIKALTHLAQRALSDTRVQHALHAIVVSDPALEVRRAAKALLESPRP
jgi:hypothetical protein